jgi:hypothetical protein
MDFFKLAVVRNMTIWEVFCATVAVYAISVVTEGIRRWWFHPLSKFPGPRFAALTLWWQFYYDIFLDGGGKLLTQLERLHKRYGTSPV